MHTYTDPQGDARQVQQFKCLDKRQHVQGHLSYVHRVPVAVAFGQTRCDHVCIANRLNLKVNTIFGLLCFIWIFTGCKTNHEMTL